MWMMTWQALFARPYRSPRDPGLRPIADVVVVAVLALLMWRGQMPERVVSRRSTPWSSGAS